MIIGSCDLQSGLAVQLVGGRDKALDAGDPAPIVERFGRVGPVAVIDLDAAMGLGDNTATVKTLLTRARCRVGGGIRTVARALDWLDAGAEQVILGTAATPEVLRELPRDRVMAAVDAVDGEVVVDGWRTRTGRALLEQVATLRPYVSGFLVTFVEREGRLAGTDLKRVPALVSAAGNARVTVAGGITSAEEVASLDKMGADAQVGMALYTGRLGLADAFAAPLTSDRPDGLWATTVCDESGVLLGLAWSNRESLRTAIDTGRGVYHSRRRGTWYKGETSGDHQDLLRVDVDCDRDTLRFTVRQHGRGFCHFGTTTCFGEPGGVAALMRTLRARVRSAPPGSYTRRLFDDPDLLRAKLIEEAGELASAETREEAVHEMADVLYFAAVALVRRGGTWADVEATLDRRAGTVRRRSGDRKDLP